MHYLKRQGIQEIRKCTSAMGKGLLVVNAKPIYTTEQTNYILNYNLYLLYYYCLIIII